MVLPHGRGLRNVIFHVPRKRGELDTGELIMSKTFWELGSEHRAASHGLPRSTASVLSSVLKL